MHIQNNFISNVILNLCAYIYKSTYIYIYIVFSTYIIIITLYINFCARKLNLSSCQGKNSEQNFTIRKFSFLSQFEFIF